MSLSFFVFLTIVSHWCYLLIFFLQPLLSFLVFGFNLLSFKFFSFNFPPTRLLTIGFYNFFSTTCSLIFFSFVFEDSFFIFTYFINCFHECYYFVFLSLFFSSFPLFKLLNPFFVAFSFVSLPFAVFLTSLLYLFSPAY